MLLVDLLGQLVAERAISPITVAQYRRAVSRFTEFLCRSATIADLNYQQVNAYLLWLETIGQSPCSIRNHRIGIICIWNYAVFPAELVPQFMTRRIRNPRLNRRPVAAWSVDSVQQLLRTTSQVSGKLRCGIPASLVLQLLIRLGTETGLRPSDLRLLQWHQIDLKNQTIQLTQHKTGGAIAVCISDDTAMLLAALKKYCLPQVLPIGKSGIRKWEAKLYQLAAAIGFVRRPGQGLGTLRKTHATEVYRTHGIAAASESLGHRSGTKIARDHYIDATAQKSYLVSLG
jgi:integrase